MLLNLAFFLTFFYGFYNFPGYGRVLDILALAIIPLETFSKYINISNNYNISAKEFALWLILLTISTQSLFSNDTRAIISVIAIFGGFFTYISLRIIRYIPDLEFIKKIGYFIVTIEIIELILYYVFDYNLDIVRYFGGISNRGLIKEIYSFRPSSIYQEPNALAVGLLFILTLAVIIPSKDLLKNNNKSSEILLTQKNESQENDSLLFIYSNIKNNLNFIILMALAIFFTASLWGILISVGTFIILFFILLFNKNSLNQLVRNSVFVFILFGSTIFSFIQISNKTFRTTYIILLKRFNNLGNDPSAIQRYGIGDYFSELSFKELLIGHGTTTTEGTFQYLLGANGFSFIVYSVGFIGIAIIFAIVFNALYRYRNKKFSNFLKIYFLEIFLIASLSSSYPMFTYALFWVWFAVSINCFQFYLLKSK